QTSVLALPQTPQSGFVVPLGKPDHALPSQCRIAPPSPTAQTSVLALPHTPRRLFVAPLGKADHALPSQCTIVPYPPTAQTSVLVLPHTPPREFVGPLEADVGLVPPTLFSIVASVADTQNML